MTRLAVPIAALTLIAAALPAAAGAACRTEAAGAARYVVCDFNPQTDDIRLFLNGADGARHMEFSAVAAALQGTDEMLAFAMNAGMYHKDRSPVGLYVEDGAELKKLSTADGPGNFHLKPNGVFFIWLEEGARGAYILTAEDYRDRMAHNDVAYATQSGPMLVIDGAIHPKFLADATSRKRRNGVGVTRDGAVVFALSDTAVTFHEFATYFRDALGTPNALYLDGVISRVFAPNIDRNDPGLPMGPIVGVVLPTPAEGNRP